MTSEDDISEDDISDDDIDRTSTYASILGPRRAGGAVVLMVSRGDW